MGVPSNPISAVADFAKGVVDHFFTDKTEAQKAKDQVDVMAAQGQLETLSAPLQAMLGQIATNQEEAKSNFFVAGWRPFIGWICGLAFLYNFVLQPFAQFAMTAFHLSIDLTQLPHLDMETMLPVLGGMLGFGGLRTVERIKGVIPRGK